MTIAGQVAFDLRRAKPRLPLLDVPAGHTPMSWLRHLTMKGAAPRCATAGPPPMLPGMSGIETDMADLWSTGITTTGHPMQSARDQLRAAGVLSSAELKQASTGRLSGSGEWSPIGSAQRPPVA